MCFAILSKISAWHTIWKKNTVCLFVFFCSRFFGWLSYFARLMFLGPGALKYVFFLTIAQKQTTAHWLRLGIYISKFKQLECSLILEIVNSCYTELWGIVCFITNRRYVPLLLTEITYTTIGIRAWIDNCIQWDVITHPCLNFGLIKLSLRLGHDERLHQTQISVKILATDWRFALIHPIHLPKFQYLRNNWINFV